LGAWNAKLQKIYAEIGRTVDVDPLERFRAKKKKKKHKRKDDVNDSHEQTASRVVETVSAAVAEGDQVLSQSSEPKTSNDKPSGTSDNSR